MSPSAVEGLLKDLFHEEGRTIISIDQIQKRLRSITTFDWPI